MLSLAVISSLSVVQPEVVYHPSSLSSYVATYEPVEPLNIKLPDTVSEMAPIAIKVTYSRVQSADYTNTYQPGQCVWYIKNSRPEIPNGWGSAYKWLASARAAGWATGSIPRVGAVGVKGNHVVLVEAVNGGIITYSDMNGSWVPFEIARRTGNAADYQYIY